MEQPATNQRLALSRTNARQAHAQEAAKRQARSHSPAACHKQDICCCEKRRAGRIGSGSYALPAAKAESLFYLKTFLKPKYSWEHGQYWTKQGHKNSP